MGYQKFKRQLLVIDEPIPDGPGGGGEVPAVPNTLAQRGSDGSLRAATGEEDDSLVNELRLNEVENGLTNYINQLTEPATTETRGVILRGPYVQELDESAELPDVIAKINELVVNLRAMGAMEPVG